MAIGACVREIRCLDYWTTAGFDHKATGCRLDHRRWRLDHRATALPVICGVGAFAVVGRAPAATDHTSGHQKCEAELTRATGTLDQTVYQTFAQAKTRHGEAPA